MKKFALSILVLSSFVYGHARLAQTSQVTPRDQNPGLKVAPCGNIARTGTPRALTGGQTITIRWEETINHPGNYFIEFSPSGDTGWVRLATIADNQNGTGDLPHQYSTTVVVPNVSCTQCTIRMVQEMTDRNPPTYYYSCGDVTVTQSGTTPPPTTTPPQTVPDEYGGPDNAERESCFQH